MPLPTRLGHLLHLSCGEAACLSDLQRMYPLLQLNKFFASRVVRTDFETVAKVRV